MKTAWKEHEPRDFYVKDIPYTGNTTQNIRTHELGLNL